jgi:hypothetical protein
VHGIPSTTTTTTTTTTTITITTTNTNHLFCGLSGNKTALKQESLLPNTALVHRYMYRTIPRSFG